jgi:hypothetical protein
MSTPADKRILQKLVPYILLEVRWDQERKERKKEPRYKKQ